MSSITRRQRSCLLAALVAVALLPRGAAAHEEPLPLSVRITSPQGRTGEPGTVRIVAQIRAAADSVVQPVQFFVDGALLATVSNGPPYATEWIDADPFSPTEIAVSVSDNLGNTARDTVLLKPFELTDATEVTRVLLDASVQDATGRFVRNLGHQAFEVREDDVLQTIDVARQEEMPATVALLVDSSQSMARRVDFVRQAASRLAGYMRPHDRMLVVPFSKTLEATTGPTDDRATILEAIAAIKPRGGTAILDALIELAPHMSGLEGRRAIVLITDGYDEHSEKSFEEALEAMKAAQATVYVVGIGGAAGISMKGERFLRALAAETGGRTFLPSREAELASVNTILAEDVQNRYLLSYTPSNQELDGAWRTITVTPADPRLTVRARAGYFAPAPPPIRPSLEFTITDLERRFMEVEIEDLVVVENGVEQTLDTFQEAVMPVSIVLALDTSGSMKKWAEAAKAAALRFVDALRPQDRLGLVFFADHSDFVHDLETERESTYVAIAQYTADGGTALYDAIGDSLERLRKVEGRRVVVVVTDGRDEDNPGTGPGSRRTFEQVLEYASQVEAAVFGIGVGKNVDRKVLETLASRSGGDAYFPEDVTELESEYLRLVENLRRRWIVSYTSTDFTRDGGWRQVEIRTRDSNSVIRSRGGYFAPER
jgi:Ca-activated chloride channel family protein